LKLLQKDVAQQIGVNTASIYNWEANRTKPEVHFMAAIVRFLGYNPLPAGQSWAERLVRGRISLGLSQKQAALRIGVDPSTLARWERADREPAGRYVVRASAFLSTADATEKCKPSVLTAAANAAD
jgi:transcriptional regulator with XRE-family HTH domain